MRELLFKQMKGRRAILILFDIFCYALINTGYYFATILFETSPDYPMNVYLANSLLLFACMFVFRFMGRVYSNVWRYTNTKAYFNLVFSDFLGAVLAIALGRFVFNPLGVWIYYGIWHFVNVSSLTALLAVMSRLSYRLIYKQRRLNEVEVGAAINVAIVGAGQLGVLLCNDLVSNKRSIYRPMFFIDKERSKVGSRVAGLPVYFEDEDVYEQIKVDSISEIFIALAALNSKEAARLYEFYSQTGCKIKIYDTPVTDTVNGSATAKRTIREFQIEDLLFREPVKMRTGKENYYKGKTVLVTGGGGSIGSELCRQIAESAPERLIIMDIYENNAYEIQQELIRKYGNSLALSVEIGSVRDRERLECIFANYRPQVVFHAAAHKHVPLMEQSGNEAIKNNVFGTYNTADMAEKYGAEKFILISTDKAVNPTNIMGASKRLCEMIVQCRSDSKTAFAAVRFGNVLGSNGSVIPLFKRQIAAGGPVTITDKRIVRYFMTIPEASQLVMTAGAMAQKGELFVLDMGKPVRIYELAINMIKLSGFEPEVDIKVEEIGLRPGEKLYEELLMKSETLDMTENKLIFIEKDAPLTRQQVEEKLSALKNALESSAMTLGSDCVKAVIAQVVPTFRDPKVINQTAAESEEMKSAHRS